MKTINISNIPTEEEIINNLKLEHLYNSEFEKGRFFQVVFESDAQVDIKLAPKTLMRVVYIKDKDNLEGIELKKIVSGQITQHIKFSKFDLRQIQSFLKFISRLDLKGITERRIRIIDDSIDKIDADTRKKISTVLQLKDGAKLIQKLFNEGVISDIDIINTGYRKKQLEIFRQLLYEPNYIQKYKNEINKPKTKTESAWQHFFNKNKWIFGFGLDYKFQSILQKEFHASTSDAAGKEEVIGDFLLGDNKFTTFVELKLPSSPIFGNSKNRANCWKLSETLIDSFSQILEQKASGQLKIETKKTLFNENGNPITQRSFDSRTILIYGNWNELKDDVLKTKEIKEKTFELFRRDSRNVEIITYDELYERAQHIANFSNGT